MANKITFDDKVSLATSALPRANKCTDDDLNEIKQVVNYNADELDLNTSNIENLKGTILYNNNDGSNSDITLNDNAENYDYLEIFFARKGSFIVYSSVKVSNPILKYVQLSLNHSPNGNTMQIYGSRIYINETTISRVQDTMFQVNNTTIVLMQTTPVDLYIFKVVGYK